MSHSSADGDMTLSDKDDMLSRSVFGFNQRCREDERIFIVRL